MKRIASILAAFCLLLLFAATARASNISGSMRYWVTSGRIRQLTEYAVKPHSSGPDQEILDLMDRYNPRMRPKTRATILSAILNSSARHGLEPLLVASVIAAESSFRPRAKSCCDARGLMQLTRMVWPYVGVTDPYDVVQNIEGGCRFLSQQMDRFGRADLSLAAYNAGPGIVGRLMRIPDYEETIHYVSKVLRLKGELQAKHSTRVLDSDTIARLTRFQSSDPLRNFAPPVPQVSEWKGSEPVPGPLEAGVAHHLPILCSPEPRRPGHITGMSGKQGSYFANSF